MIQQLHSPYSSHFRADIGHGQDYDAISLVQEIIIYQIIQFGHFYYSYDLV